MIEEFSGSLRLLPGGAKCAMHKPAEMHQCQREIMTPLHIHMEDVSSSTVISTGIELASSAVDHPEVSSPDYCTSQSMDGGDSLPHSQTRRSNNLPTDY